MARRCGIAFALALLAGACSKTEPAAGAPAAAAPSGSYLTVDAYCSGFCGKLCGTCGAASCPGACTPACYHGRAPDMALDGKDPKVALALTRRELDGCLATITVESCPKILQGQVPPACFTVQH